MKLSAKTAILLAGLIVFLGLPLLFYALGDAPRRSLLKEGLSLVTLLSFCLMLGQFYLARSNATLLAAFKPPLIQKVHKYIAYGALSVILLHPALIVLPRYFEGGIRPWDAFVTMITSFDNLGIVLGLIAWGLLVVLGLSAFFRKRLFPKFATRYRGWRYFHGALATGFVTLGLWHAIDLGRHTDVVLSAFLIGLALIGSAMLAKLYWDARPKPAVTPTSQGAAS